MQHLREKQPALIDNNSSLYGTRNDLVKYNEYFQSVRPLITGVSVMQSARLIESFSDAFSMRPARPY